LGYNKNKFAVLDSLEGNRDVSRAWVAVKKNIKIYAKEFIGHCEAKHHKTWFG
jgi:hypothetical protein